MSEVAHTLASNGADPLLFAFRESTLPGKLILFLLFIGSIFSWSVMVTKIRVIRYARGGRENSWTSSVRIASRCGFTRMVRPTTARRCTRFISPAARK